MALFTDPRIRNLFSNTVLENLDANHVWDKGFNTNYEGEISGKGQSLRIFSFPRPDVDSYNVPSTDLSGQVITYQRLSPTAQELIIDQDKVWAIAEDRLQDMLANPKAFAQLAENAAWKLLDESDRFLAVTLNNGAGLVNELEGPPGFPFTGVGGAPIVGNGGADDITAYVVMEMLAELLKNNSVPATDLHLFVPTWFYTMLRTDLRFTGYGTTESRATIRGEMITKVAGITIHETINALDGAGTAFSTVPDANAQNRIILNWRGAATWGRHVNPNSMVDTIDAERNVLSHDNLMRARYVFGGKVTIAEGVIAQTVQRGSYEV